MNKKEAVDLVAAFESSLLIQSKPSRAEFEKNYHKSDLRFLGAGIPAVRAECMRFYRENRLISRADLDVLLESLWGTKCHELRSVAICLMVRYAQLFNYKDLPFIKRLITESAGWAHVDWISIDLLGNIYTRHPNIETKLRTWSMSKDFWVRRASMLALLDESRHGNRKAFDVFAEFASTMIEEKEFFIRKAIGWVLREVSKKQPQWAFDFLMQHKNTASGLTMREGSKYLSEKLKKQLGWFGSAGACSSTPKKMQGGPKVRGWAALFLLSLGRRIAVYCRRRNPMLSLECCRLVKAESKVPG